MALALGFSQGQGAWIGGTVHVRVERIDPRKVRLSFNAPEDVTITFDFFEQLGAAHTVLGAFAWSGHEDEVIFTRFEPDYLYDTGYRAPVSEQMAQYFKLGVKHIFGLCGDTSLPFEIRKW